MYTDLLDQVTGGTGTGNAGRGGRGGRNQRSNANASSNDDTSNEIVVRFKAGRIELKKINNETRSVPSNITEDNNDNDKENITLIDNKYQCIAKPDRGEVRLMKSSSNSSTQPPKYTWQWYNRTTESIDETNQLIASTTSTNTATTTIAHHTFERVTLPNQKKYELDRIYVWTEIPPSNKSDDTEASSVSSSVSSEVTPSYRMYWMQDADPTLDESIVTSVNEFFKEAAIAAKTRAVAAATTTTTTTGTSSTSQVDALSSILENLGMPQTTTNSVTSMDTTTASSSGMDPPATTSSSTTAATAGRNQLTLADLQGAMATIQQQLQQQQTGTTTTTTVGPPLQDIITSQAIDTIMNDPAACQRLIQYLPPEQQSIEFLRDNLNSSSIQSTLRTLTQMLLQRDDDTDDVDIVGTTGGTTGNNIEYANIIANFQLDPNDGEDALIHEGNPIQAFLNCIIASVERENNETNNNNDNMMEDTTTENVANSNNDAANDDNDNDVPMNDDETDETKQ